MKYLLVLFFLVYMFSSSWAYNVASLSEYLKIKQFLEKNKNKINSDKADKIIEYLQGSACNYVKEKNYYFVDPVCIADGFYPKLDFINSINKVWPLIRDFSQIYDLKSTSFVYSSAKPEFYIKYDLNKIFGDSKFDLLTLSILQLANYKIKIPDLYLAFNQIKDYSFFVSAKDLSKRNRGRLNNFNVALQQIDNFVLTPGEILNFNKKIAYLPGYDTSNTTGQYAFYGGVCGVSTMIFRSSLLNPFLKVLKRYNHNLRYVYFYSPYIYGDDASMYQFIKTLEIKNISKYPILFKTKKIGKELYLVSIVPKVFSGLTYIQKYQTGPLSAFVSTKHYDSDGNLLFQQERVSKYSGKSYER